MHGQADSIFIYVGLRLNLKGLLNLKPVSPLGLMITNPKANTGLHPLNLFKIGLKDDLYSAHLIPHSHTAL